MRNVGFMVEWARRRDVQVGCTARRNWSGSGVEVIGGVRWSCWTDRRTDGWRTMKGSGDKVDACA